MPSASAALDLDAVRDYAPRRPVDSPLYRLLQHHLEPFLATAARGDPDTTPVPPFVRKELQKYLRCGILAHGFSRLRCPDCHEERLVPFTCKGRGLCPSCGGKRMTELAAHLLERVVPVVPTRQWVLSLPHRLRYRLAYDHELCCAALRVFTRALCAHYRQRARKRGTADGRSGTVTFIQRFGGALNLNVHFHTVALDGVFFENAAEELHFHKLPPPSDDEVARLVVTVRARILRLLSRRGILDDDTFEDPLAGEHPVLAAVYAGSVRQKRALGPHRGWGVARVGSDPDAVPVERCSRRHAHRDGFDLHANVAVRRSRRDKLERLLRYCARPPIASERLHELPDGRIALRLKSPWSDGTSHLVFEPDELLERICSLIPRPQINLVVYHGVLAPNARWRRRVVTHGRAALPQTTTAPPMSRAALRQWAALMQRAFRIDVLACPRCGGRMKLLAVLIDPRVVRRILLHLGIPADAPSVTPARAPPELDFADDLYDQSA